MSAIRNNIASQASIIAGFEGLIGVSEAMQAVFRQIQRVAGFKTTVLISGESGTGKELIARAIHTLSVYEQGPFLALNCSALPQDLLESELFGHTKGAFTGATAARPGLFEAAHKGTLFLDEVGDLAQDAQAKLLRAIEERQITRVGSTRSITVDVRVLAATHIDLEAAVQQGRFRDDLYYRLHVFTIALPPLRDRTEDIPLLVRVFLDRFAGENELPPKEISPEALACLKTYRWPGNVRELKNLLECLTIVLDHPVIERDHLPVEYQSATNETSSALFAVGMSLEEIEQGAIKRTLEHTKGNRTQAARMLRIGLRTLQRKMKTYGIL